MKKIKLLAPILGMAAIAGAVVPMVSCVYHVTEKDVEVSAVNLNAEVFTDANLRITESKSTDDDLVVSIKWDNHVDSIKNDTDYYYPYSTTIQIDKTIILQKSAICPYGFTTKYDTENLDGYEISIPLIHCKKGSKIEIDVDLRVQSSTYDCICHIPNVRKYEGKKYDVIESYQIPHVIGERTVFFAADLSKYVVELSDNEPIYFAVRGSDDGWTTTWIGLDRTNISGVYCGETLLETEPEDPEERYTDWIGIYPPEGGWSKAPSNIITGHYFFNEYWDYVTLMLGVPQQ